MSDGEIKTTFNYSLPVRVLVKLQKIADHEGVGINKILTDLVDLHYPDSKIPPTISSIIPSKK